MKHSSLTQESAHIILADFDFYHGVLDEFSIIPQRLTNQNARFRIGVQKWVIKRYDRDAAPQNLRLSHELQSALLDAGFPIATLERNREGKSLIEHGPHLYSIHQWIDGKHHSPIETGEPPGAKLIQEVAKGLGEFHKLVTHLFPCNVDADLMQSQTLLKGTREGAQAFLSRNRLHLRGDTRLKLKPLKTNLDRLILRALPRFEMLANQLANFDAHSLPALKEVILTHNDINWLNMIFDDQDNLKAIIDFDNIQYAPRQLEIGSAALVVAGGDARLLDDFLTAYQTASGLSVDPIATRLSMLVRSARSFFWSIQTYRQNAIQDLAMLESWIQFLESSVTTLSQSGEFRELLER